MVAVYELNVLEVAAGGIVVGGARFFEHFSRHAALSRSTEYENHSFLFLVPSLVSGWQLETRTKD